VMFAERGAGEGTIAALLAGAGEINTGVGVGARAGIVLEGCQVRLLVGLLHGWTPGREGVPPPP
jgi:hypothetical protein